MSWKTKTLQNQKHGLRRPLKWSQRSPSMETKACRVMILNTQSSPTKNDVPNVDVLDVVGETFWGMKNRSFNLDLKLRAFGKHWYFKNIRLKPIMLFSLLPQAQDKKMRKLNITSNHVETKTQRRVNHFSDLSEYTRCWCAKHCVPEQASFSNSIAFSSGRKKQLLAALLILH